MECGESREHYHTCGWCPIVLPCDMTQWPDHHFFTHGVVGHSVRYVLGPADWDLALASLGPAPI